jgi:hypothetical protein
MDLGKARLTLAEGRKLGSRGVGSAGQQALITGPGSEAARSGRAGRGELLAPHRSTNQPSLADDSSSGREPAHCYDADREAVTGVEGAGLVVRSGVAATLALFSPSSRSLAARFRRRRCRRRRRGTRALAHRRLARVLGTSSRELALTISLASASRPACLSRHGLSPGRRRT